MANFGLNFNNLINDEDLKDIKNIDQFKTTTKEEFLQKLLKISTRSSLKKDQAKRLVFYANGKPVSITEYMESLFDADATIDTSPTSISYTYEAGLYLKDAAQYSPGMLIDAEGYNIEETWSFVANGKAILAQFYAGSPLLDVYQKFINSTPEDRRITITDTEWNALTGNDLEKFNKVIALKKISVASATTYYLNVSGNGVDFWIEGRLEVGSPGSPSKATELKRKYDLILAAKKGKLKKSIVNVLNIGHTVSAVSQYLAKQDLIINTLLNDKDYIEADPSREVWLKEIRNDLEVVLQRSIAVDRLFLKLETDLSQQIGANKIIDRTTIKTILRNLMNLTSLTGHEVELVYNSSAGVVTSKGIKTSIDATVYIIEGAAFNAEFKGKGLTNDIASLWKRYLKGTLNNQQLLTELITSVASTSILGQTALVSLDQVFKSKKFSKRIVKSKKIRGSSKSPKEKAVRVDNKKALALINKSNKRIAANRKKIKNYKRKQKVGTKQTVRPTSFGTTNLLNTINSELKKAIIDAMVYPALVHRTGKFADSVKVLGLNETQTSIFFDFIYKKDPYQVFSRSRGRSPWKSPERDPETIVSNAVKNIIYRNINNVKKEVQGRAG